MEYDDEDVDVEVDDLAVAAQFAAADAEVLEHTEPLEAFSARAAVVKQGGVVPAESGDAAAAASDGDDASLSDSESESDREEFMTRVKQALDAENALDSDDDGTGKDVDVPRTKNEVEVSRKRSCPGWQ